MPLRLNIRYQRQVCDERLSLPVIMDFTLCLY
jgi:hypothetical protein